MSLASLKAAFKSVFNSPEEEVERHIREDELNDEMSIAKGITQNICLNAEREGVEFLRLKATAEDLASLYYVRESGEEECGQLPLEMAINLARRTRVLANIDGWGHLNTTPNEMEVSALGKSYILKVTRLEFAPALDVLFQVVVVQP